MSDLVHDVGLDFLSGLIENEQSWLEHERAVDCELLLSAGQITPRRWSISFNIGKAEG